MNQYRLLQDLPEPAHRRSREVAARPIHEGPLWSDAQDSLGQGDVVDALAILDHSRYSSKTTTSTTELPSVILTSRRPDI